MTVTEFKAGTRKTKRKDISLIIQKSNYPTEEIKLSAQNIKKIESPGNKKERKTIKAALKKETNKIFLEGNYLKRPSRGRISGVFGASRRTPDRVLWQHRGVDIAGGRQAVVKSAAPGIVILAREDFNLHGKTVIINHGGGIMTLYIHLDSVKVKKGDKVSEGNIIGYIGDTGVAVGPHLHWGVYLHGTPVNPEDWLRGE
ncbi:MAG: M23 family metallopeptidase [Elusimicrobia bacterium]|jgi:murein DD-endopeptidase MepM/ murein hydrolase activator NlpD|nr:M23 family metallopeptidase [Elusimicrobiota bacterium]